MDMVACALVLVIDYFLSEPIVAKLQTLASTLSYGISKWLHHLYSESIHSPIVAQSPKKKRW